MPPFHIRLYNGLDGEEVTPKNIYCINPRKKIKKRFLLNNFG